MRKAKTMINNKPMFAKHHFKYIFILTALAWMTYTLPAVRAAFETSDAFDGSANIAAAASPIGSFFASLIGREPQNQALFSW